MLIACINNDDIETAKYMLSDESDTGKVFSDTQDAITALTAAKIDYSKQMASASQRQGKAAIFFMIGLSVLVLILAIGLGVFISRLISRPIQALVQAADKIALGEIDISVEANAKDEMGTLMASFGRMVDNIKSQAAVAERIAEGDLSAEIVPRSEKDILSISLASVLEI